ncbi:hypothetical protein D3C75_588730 [compost metagenome]
MYNVNELLAEADHKIINESHPVELALLRRNMTDAILPAVYEILSCQRVAIFFSKEVKRSGTHRKIIGTPVREQMAVALTAAPNPGEIIE